MRQLCVLMQMSLSPFCVCVVVLVLTWSADTRWNWSTHTQSFPVQWNLVTVFHWDLSTFPFLSSALQFMSVSTCERNSNAEDGAGTAYAAGQFLPGYRGCWNSPELQAPTGSCSLSSCPPEFLLGSYIN